jgi:hypothetical protein
MRRRVALFIAVFCFTVPSFAQVTIRHGSSLSDLINNLYGGNGIQLRDTGHQAHFGDSQDFQQFSATLGQVLQARPLYPIPSAVGLASYKFNEETGTYERVQGSFGPLLAERASTTGKGAVNVALFHSISDFQQIDGNETASLVLQHCLTEQCAPDPDSPFLQDVIAVETRIRLKSQALSAAFVYGLTDRFDVGLVIPLLRNDLRVETHGEIIRGPNSPAPGVHEFDIAVETPDQMGTAHASGIGDLVARGKMRLGSNPLLDTAVLADLTLPTGDEENFLGTGAVRAKATFIASHTGTRVSPHINIGYEQNFDETDLSLFDYRLGTEFLASPRLTIAADILGIVRPNADELFEVRALRNQRLIGKQEIDGAIGGKFQIGANTVLAVNLLIPLNDAGIRPEMGFTFGVQRGF